jgi:hypothetical protein
MPARPSGGACARCKARHLKVMFGVRNGLSKSSPGVHSVMRVDQNARVAPRRVLRALAMSK